MRDGKQRFLICDNPIRRLLPSSLSRTEKDWIALALRYDFPERRDVIEQLSMCDIAREETPYGLELIFDGINEACNLSNRTVVELGAMRESGIWVCAQLLSRKGKLDSFYIYTPDGSDLCLDLKEFDDAWFNVTDYLAEANRRIEDLYSLKGSDESREEIRFEGLTRIANSNRKRFREGILTDIVSRLGDCNLREYDSGPYSISLRMDLGMLSAHAFYGIARISLLGEFYCVYAVSEADPNVSCTNYPSGERLLELGDMLSGSGFKVLSQHYLSTVAQYQPHAYKGKTPATISDCLFAGFDIL